MTVRARTRWDYISKSSRPISGRGIQAEFESDIYGGSRDICGDTLSSYKLQANSPFYGLIFVFGEIHVFRFLHFWWECGRATRFR